MIFTAPASFPREMRCSPLMLREGGPLLGEGSWKGSELSCVYSCLRVLKRSHQWEDLALTSDIFTWTWHSRMVRQWEIWATTGCHSTYLLEAMAGECTGRGDCRGRGSQVASLERTLLCPSLGWQGSTARAQSATVKWQLREEGTYKGHH